jgi:hypothetical protein
MRKTITKRIRHSDGGVNIAADIDAVIAINTGEDAKASRTEAHSSHVVVQGVAGRRSRPRDPTADANDPPKETP